MRAWSIGEKIELAVYKFADSFNRGEPKTTNVRGIAALVASSADVDVTDALLRMYRRGHLSLDKWVAEARRFVPMAEFREADTLFWGPPYGDFRVGLTPDGRLDFEKKALQQPIVFISCGQWHENEKLLGQALLAAVNETPPLRGYFAEYQSSLSNLSRHIFEA